MALPDSQGIGDKVGQVCPHNVYEHESELFDARDAQSGYLMHLFRLLKSADLGVLQESDLEPDTLTELITARAELDRIQQERNEKEAEQRRIEQQQMRAQQRPPNRI